MLLVQPCGYALLVLVTLDDRRSQGWKPHAHASFTKGVTDVSARWAGPRRTPQDESCGYRYEARFSGRGAASRGR
ncbi:MAG: hypothetical protein M3R61_19015, partial [Chloroflexota bacterium]|nr:hypothetical protein [Chloroflexota bacterium]